MDLVIRLKRPRNSDPFEALVLASKRRKTDDDENDASTAKESVPTILKFAGTLNHQEEDISPHIFKARQHEGLKSFAHLKSKDVIKKTREDAKKASKENRFKVVNFSRHGIDALIDHDYVGSDSDPKSPNVKQYTIVDVVHDLPSEPSHPDVEEDGYVYSLYYADAAGGQGHDVFLDSVISIEPLDMSNYPLYDDRNQDEDIIPDDEDDSNDENNWRNDYPDSDYDNERNIGDNSDESVENMMGGLKLGSENELSSDDGEDDLPYGVDADEMEHLGRGYASYKARVTKELKEVEDDEVDCESGDTSEEN